MENGVVILEHVDFVDALKWLHAVFLERALHFFVVPALGFVKGFLLSSLAAFAASPGIADFFK